MRLAPTLPQGHRARDSLLGAAVASARHYRLQCVRVSFAQSVGRIAPHRRKRNEFRMRVGRCDRRTVPVVRASIVRH